MDAAPAHDHAAGREVGPGNQPDEFLELLLGAELRRIGRREQRVLDEPHRAFDHLAEVVRRDVRGHAHGDAGGPVDEQVRIHRREDGGFGRGFVEVRNVVDRVLVEVVHHRFGKRFEARFRVAIGGRTVAVDRTEVALAIHQGLAHVEVLRQAHQRVVGRGVAVWMVVADDLADDLGALAVGAVARQTHLPHGEEHAPVRGLQPVTYVGKRAPDDHAHRVIQVRALHLVFDVDGNARFSSHRV